MSATSEILHLRQDLESIQALLEKLPASRVLERLGFEARREEVQERLSVLESGRAAADAIAEEEAAPATPARPPVQASAHARRAEELARLEALLANLPESRVLERAGLEARRDELSAELAHGRQLATIRRRQLASTAAPRHATLHVSDRRMARALVDFALRFALLAGAITCAALGQTAILLALLFVLVGVEVSQLLLIRRRDGGRPDDGSVLGTYVALAGLIRRRDGRGPRKEAPR